VKTRFASYGIEMPNSNDVFAKMLAGRFDLDALHLS